MKAVVTVAAAVVEAVVAVVTTIVVVLVVGVILRIVSGTLRNDFHLAIFRTPQNRANLLSSLC